MRKKGIWQSSNNPTGWWHKCQVLWVFIREWQSTNEGLGNGAYRKTLFRAR